MSSLPPLRTKVGADTSGFTGGINAAVASLGGFQGALGTAGIALGAFIGAKGIGAAIGAFARFDEKMTESQAIMDDLSGETMARMERAALDVSRTTLKSADEAAESYFFLASAGLDAEQSIAALPQVARFAQAGMFDMATATELATDAQSSLGLTSQDAQQNLQGLTRTTDVLTAANQQANATVEQFSEALTNKLGPRLRILNKDIEEGTAGLAALADQGIKGRRAGQGLSIVFRDLAREAVSSEAAFERLGIRVFDAEGNMRNLADIVADFEQKLGGMNDKQRTAELQMLGINRRAISFLNTLIGMSDEMAEYEDNLRSAGGATEEVANKQVETLSRQVELAGAEIATATIKTGGWAAEVLNLEENVGLLRRGLRNMREGVQGFSDRMANALDPEMADELTTAIDQVGFQFDEVAPSQLEEQVTGLLESLPEEGRAIFAAQVFSAIDAVKDGRIEAENLNSVISRRHRLLARNLAERRQAREEQKEQEKEASARQKQVEQRRKTVRKREDAIRQVQMRRLEQELGLTDRIIAREEAKLDRLIRQEAEQKQILSQAKKIAELRREGVPTAERFQPGVTTPAAARQQEAEGLPASEQVEGPAGGMPDVEDLDVSDPVGRTVDALEKGLVPALDELAGQAFQGQSAILSLADALLTSFADEFSGEEGLLGFGSKVVGAFAGGFQHGGRVPAGAVGIMGEEGPEPFVAPRGGRVLSNPEARKALKEGGGKREVNINVQTEVRALDAKGVDDVLRRGGQDAIVEAVLEATRQNKDVSRALVTGGG